MNAPSAASVFEFVMRKHPAVGVTYPTWTVDSAPYWIACAEGRLTYQLCDDCGSNVFHPRAMCPYCLSGKLSWRQSAGVGHIYSYSVQHVHLDRSRPQRPRAMGIIHVKEDYYMFSEIVSDQPEQLRIGQEVRVFFERIADDLTLPKFKPV